MAGKTITLGKAAEADVELELFGQRYALAKPTRKTVRHVAELQAKLGALSFMQDPEADGAVDADQIDDAAHLLAHGVEAMTLESDGLASLICAAWDDDELAFPDLMDLFGDLAEAFNGATEVEGND